MSTSAASTARSRSADLSGRGGTNGSNRFGSSLSASYELDFWGRNQSIRAAADQNALATRFDRDTVALTVAATTATTYVRILAAKDRRRIANQNLQSATRVLTIIRERLEVGTATALDLAQQESVVANVRANIPPLEQIIAQETATLAVLLGRAPERAGRGRGKHGPARGAAHRTRRALDAADAAAPISPPRKPSSRPRTRMSNAARAAFFPTISLTAQGGLESLALRSLFNEGAGFYAIGAGLTQPIFEGFRLEGQLRAATGTPGRAAAGLQKLRHQRLRGRGAGARSPCDSSPNRSACSGGSLQVRGAPTDIAEQRLREGTVDLITVLNTQTTLFQAEDALTQVRLARFLAAVSLLPGAGRRLDVAATTSPQRRTTAADKPRP